MASHFERFEDVKKLYMLPYDAHTSPTGHKIIAAELEKKIKEVMAN
jgi:hypothetical protein